MLFFSQFIYCCSYIHQLNQCFRYIILFISFFQNLTLEKDVSAPKTFRQQKVAETSSAILLPKRLVPKRTESDYQSVTSGVPQGSILGPLLFVIFINDLPQSCINSILYLYADDSKLKNNISLTDFQLDLNNCLIWGDNNAMKFNSIKTNFLDFGTNSSTLFIKCAHDTIIPSELVKDLGVYFNEKLKWSQHISKKLSTCYGLFQDLKRQLPDKLDMRTKLRVYKQFLMPVLFYASEAWFPSSNDISRMERFQNHVSKWIVTERDYPSRLLKTELLPIKMAL